MSVMLGATFGLVAWGVHQRSQVEWPKVASSLAVLLASLYVLEPRRLLYLSTLHAVLAFFGSAVGAATIYRACFHPLNRLPGPFLARFTRAWMFRQVVTGRKHWMLLALHRTYGDYVRIGPNEVSIADISCFKDIHVRMTKSSFYDTLPELKGSIRSLGDLRDRTEHARRRRVWDAAFSKASLATYESTTKAKAHDAVEGMVRRAREGPVDLRRELSYYTWTMMYLLSFGAHGNDMVEIGPHPRWDATFIAVESFMRMFVVLFVLPWFLKIAPYIPPDRQVVRFVHDIQRQYEERIRDPVGSEDIFSHFLAGVAAAQTKEEKDRLTAEMEADAGLLFGAGADTTLTTLTHLFFWLLIEPGQPTYKALQQQVDAAFKEGGELNDHELAERCPLLDACIRESLRMMPPTPGGLERDVGPAGVTFAGYHFQTGTRVSMPFLALGRDPRHFKEPDSFRPVRWLNGEDMERMAFNPFALGQQACVGKHLAYQIIRHMIAAMLRRVDLELVDGFDADAFSRAQNDFFTTHLPMALPVRVIPRQW